MIPGSLRSVRKVPTPRNQFGEIRGQHDPSRNWQGHFHV